MDLADKIRTLMAERGLSGAALAKLASVSQPTINDLLNRNQKSSKFLPEIAIALGVEPAYLDERLARAATTANYTSRETLDRLGPPSVEIPANPPPFPYRDAKAQKIKVFGLAQGGDDGTFMFNGEVVEYIQMPPGLADKKDAYALRVANDSMVPRYFPGEPIFVSPHRPPVNGDFVVIEMFPEEGETAGRGYVKQLSSRRGQKILVKQFNPVSEIEFDVREVKAMHRVYWPEELY